MNTDEWLQCVRDNDQHLFDQMITKNSNKVGFVKILYAIYTENGGMRNDEQFENDKQQFFTLLEHWVLRQDLSTQQLILGSHELGFSYDFLRRHNVEQFIDHIDIQAYSNIRVFGGSFFAQLAKKENWKAVDAFLQKTNILQCMESTDFNKFFDALLKNDAPYMATFLERMKDQYAPNWVSALLEIVIKNNHHDVCAAICAQRPFQQWLETSQFANMYLKKDWCNNILDVQHVQAFEQHFDPSTWRAMVQYLGHANVFGRHNEQWQEYIKIQLSGAERINFVRHMFETDFNIHEKEEYGKGVTGISNEKFQEISDKILQFLTLDDAQHWLKDPFWLDQYYRIHEHPVMVNALLTEHTAGPHKSSLSRKM